MLPVFMRRGDQRRCPSQRACQACSKLNQPPTLVFRKAFANYLGPCPSVTILQCKSIYLGFLSLDQHFPRGLSAGPSTWSPKLDVLSSCSGPDSQWFQSLWPKQLALKVELRSESAAPMQIVYMYIYTYIYIFTYAHGRSPFWGPPGWRHQAPYGVMTTRIVKTPRKVSDHKNKL